MPQEATIKILTPQTSNGLLNIMDDDGRMVYRESIVPAGQRKYFEKLNTQLPPNLQHKIVDNAPAAVTESKLKA